MNADLTGLAWLKSSRSNGTGNCVEVATNLADHGIVGLRDSKDPHGPVLAVNPDSWAAFLSGIKDREFDL